MSADTLEAESPRTLASQVSLRPYDEADREELLRLLSVLPVLYPGGEAWLGRRLSELRPGGPECTLLIVDEKLAGVAIETPKSPDRLKLSTFFIDNEFRGQGYGTLFAQHLQLKWRHLHLESVHVTVAETCRDQLIKCLGKIGFTCGKTIQHRYGPDRHETILHWSLKEQNRIDPGSYSPYILTTPIESSKV